MLVSPIPIMFSMTRRSVRGCDHGRNKYCQENSTIYKLDFLSAYFSAVSICLGEKTPTPNFDHGRKLWKAVKKGVASFTINQQQYIEYLYSHSTSLGPLRNERRNSSQRIDYYSVQITSNGFLSLLGKIKGKKALHSLCANLCISLYSSPGSPDSAILDPLLSLNVAFFYYTSMALAGLSIFKIFSMYPHGSFL